MHILHVKNIVCQRCIRVVREELTKANFAFDIGAIELGTVSISRPPTDAEKLLIQTILINNGFELIDDRRSRLIEQMKTLIIDEIHYQRHKKPDNQNFSDFLATQTLTDYSTLSTLFSQTEGTTIEKYIIAQKTERIKELLAYDELTLSAIAFQLDYSSPQHLSNQFKRETGFTPSQFKALKEKKRRTLDTI
jgi:AraC family transcriptional regulator